MTSVVQLAPLVHGYTLAKIDEAAWAAVRMKGNVRVKDPRDFYDAAWHAIVELLYTQEEPPTYFDLVNTGKLAIQHEINTEFHHSGIDNKTGQAGPNIGKYWAPVVGPQREGFAERVVDRLAIPQILGYLTDVEYEVLSATIQHESQTLAAAALGMSRWNVQKYMASARARFAAAWFDPDHAPVRRRASETECGAGHARSQHGFKRPDGRWGCRICNRNATRRARARGTVTEVD